MHVDTQLSKDTSQRACHGAFAMRRRASGLDDRSSAAPRTTTWRTYRGNVGYAETLSRL